MAGVKKLLNRAEGESNLVKYYLFKFLFESYFYWLIDSDCVFEASEGLLKLDTRIKRLGSLNVLVRADIEAIKLASVTILTGGGLQMNSTPLVDSHLFILHIKDLVMSLHMLDTLEMVCCPVQYWEMSLHLQQWQQFWPESSTLTSSSS